MDSGSDARHDAASPDGGGAPSAPADAGGGDATVPLDAGTDAASEASTPAPDAGTTGPDASPTECTRALLVRGFALSSVACTINTNVANGVAGTLTYPCGDGTATASLGSLRFTGTVTGDAVSLISASSRFPFGGCSWESSQRLTGTLSGSSLHYAYMEAVISGGCSGVGACSASATVDTR